ncbi:MAG: DNA primase [Pseudomonadota bacterium]
MAGRIPQAFIDDLVARADIAEVVGARMNLKRAGREYKGLCPFHGEKTPSFTVSPEKGFYHCFGCGAHGTALGFLMEHDHLSFVEAVEQVAGMLGIEVPREAGGTRERGSDEVAELLRRAAELYTEQLKQTAKAVDYLKARGIDGETARRYQLGYAPDAWDTVLSGFGDAAETRTWLEASGLLIKRDDGKTYDRFRDRVMFPIRDARGRTIAFGGRIVGSGEPKYLNSPETVLFSKRRELYGLYEARRKLRDIDLLVVVEGYMDVVALARHGIDYAVATLGTATTPEHLNRLFRVTERVVFCFDGDRAGRQAAWRALETALPEVRDGRQIAFVFLPDGEDPDSLVSSGGAAAFEEALEGAVPLSDFLVQELKAQVDTGSIDGRARLAALARPLLSKMQASAYRTLLLGELAESVGIKTEKLEQLMGAPVEPASERKMRRRVRVGGGRKLTPVQKAVQALLHHPSLAELADTELLAAVDKDGTATLREVLEICNENPQITSAVLFERLRTHQYSHHFAKLLESEFLEGGEIDLRSGFSELIDHIVFQARKRRLSELRLLPSRDRTEEEEAEQRELELLVDGRSQRTS